MVQSFADDKGELTVTWLRAPCRGLVQTIRTAWDEHYADGSEVYHVFFGQSRRYTGQELFPELAPPPQPDPFAPTYAELCQANNIWP